MSITHSVESTPLISATPFFPVRLLYNSTQEQELLEEHEENAALAESVAQGNARNAADAANAQRAADQLLEEGNESKKRLDVTSAKVVELMGALNDAEIKLKEAISKTEVLNQESASVAAALVSAHKAEVAAKDAAIEGRHGHTSELKLPSMHKRTYARVFVLCRTALGSAYCILCIYRL